MISAVLDTNVLASGFLSQATAPGQLLAAWQDGSFQLIVSEPILEELGQTFNDPYFRRRLSSQQIEANLALLRQQATVANITAQVPGVATHPEDDLIIATALSSGAQYLVTGDMQLQRLGAYQEVTILSPRSFLDVLEL